MTDKTMILRKMTRMERKALGGKWVLELRGSAGRVMTRATRKEIQESELYRRGIKQGWTVKAG